MDRRASSRVTPSDHPARELVLTCETLQRELWKTHDAYIRRARKPRLRNIWDDRKVVRALKKSAQQIDEDLTLGLPSPVLNEQETSALAAYTKWLAWFDLSDQIKRRASGFEQEYARQGASEQRLVWEALDSSLRDESDTSRPTEQAEEPDPKKCPECGLLNPASVEVCDCGYTFVLNVLRQQEQIIGMFQNPEVQARLAEENPELLQRLITTLGLEATAERCDCGHAFSENGGAKLDHRAANRSCFWAE